MTVRKAAAFITCTGAEIAMIVIAAVGAGTGGYAAYEQGQTAKETGEYNKEMGERREKDALVRGADQAAEARLRARKVAAKQTEGAAMSGVEVTSGTPLALLTETAGLGELDALRALNNAQREGWGYGAQAELDSFSGRAAGRGGKLNAAGTVLTSASNTYYGMRKAT